MINKRFSFRYLLFIALLALPGSAGAYALSAPQVQSILGLLSSFGVPQDTLATVGAILHGEASAPAAPQNTCTIFTDSLTQGSSGPGVEALQQTLKSLGYFTVDVTGYFGPVTAQAVVDFQLARDIEPFPGVGPLTRAALNALPCEAPSFGVESAPSPVTRISPRSSSSSRRAGDAESTPLDTAAPTISSIASVPSVTTATITWTTDEPSDSTIVYGFTTSYGLSSTSAALVALHSVRLTAGLASGVTYHYAVVSTDAQGNTSTSTDRTFRTVDNTAPTVSVSAPSNSATVSGADVILSATASDNVALAGVKFYVAGVLQGSEDTSSPFAVAWDSTATSSGVKSVVAVARDTSGNAATSSPISITVDNAAPVSSSIASSTGPATAIISWTTDESSNSKLVYGLSASYGLSSTSAALVTSHVIQLSGLPSATSYHYAVVSTDEQGNTSTSTDRTFTTAAVQSIAAVVGQNKGVVGGATLSNLAFAGNVTAGNQVIVTVHAYRGNGSPSISTPTKVSGTATIGSFVRDATSAVSSGSMFFKIDVYRAPVIASGSLSIGLSGSFEAALGAINEYAHMAASPVDGSAVYNTGTGATESSGSVTTTAAGGMVLMASLETSDINFTYTQSGTNVFSASQGDAMTGQTQYALAPTAGAYTLTAGTGNSWDWMSVAVPYLAYSGIVSSDTTAPSTPSGLSASALSSSRVSLTWSASTDDTGVAGYNIYRNGGQVGTSASTSYTDTGLSASTLYSYTVSAYDAATNESSQSSSATATTDDAATSFSLGDTPFASGSSWNTPVSGSATYTAIAWPASTGFNYSVSWDAYSPAVYVSQPTDPLVQVDVPASWGYPAGNKAVRLPSGITGADGTDGEILIIDGTTVHNFWQFNRTSDTTATASSYGKSDVLTGSGWGSSSPFLSAGITAAGTSQFAGLLVQAETDAGEITHALQFVGDAALTRPGFTGEAIAGDGPTGGGILQEGERYAIPTTTSMPSGLSALGQKVFRALQTYGAFNIDIAGGVSNLRVQQNAYDDPTMTDLWHDTNQILPLLRLVVE